MCIIHTHTGHSVFRRHINSTLFRRCLKLQCEMYQVNPRWIPCDEKHVLTPCDRVPQCQGGKFTRLRKLYKLLLYYSLLCNEYTTLYRKVISLQIIPKKCCWFCFQNGNTIWTLRTQLHFQAWFKWELFKTIALYCEAWWSCFCESMTLVSALFCKLCGISGWVKNTKNYNIPVQTCARKSATMMLVKSKD